MRSDWRCSFLPSWPPCRLGAQPQPLTAALRLAQDGRIDSARATLKHMEQSTLPTDSLFPGILYSSALIAPTAEEVRPLLQRVVVEYPFSRWAEPSLIALAQLDYANGDPAGAARTLEKFRTRSRDLDAVSRSLPSGARGPISRSMIRRRRANGSRRPAQGRSGRDLDTRELVGPRSKVHCAACHLARVDATCTAVAGSRPVEHRSPRPRHRLPLRHRHLPAPAPEPSPAPPATGRRPGRVQIVAANSQEAADEILARARSAGFKGVIVKDGGYFKVRLGQYATRAEASAAAAKVKAKLGGSPFVVAP